MEIADGWNIHDHMTLNWLLSTQPIEQENQAPTFGRMRVFSGIREFH
jgi:hypothetical protein